jgi:hypothetical protein
MQSDPSATRPVPSAVSRQPETRRITGASILAIVAGLVSILAFFALPYYHISTRARPLRGFAPTGRALAGGVADLPDILHHPIFWLVPLAGLFSFVFALLPLFIRAVGERGAGIAYLSTGIVGVVALLIGILGVNADLNRAVGRAGRIILRYGAGFGFWLTAAAMIGLIVAGAVALSRSD